MSTLESREAAFASQNYDPVAVKLEGVPAHHIDAVIGFINLCVAHDAANEGYQPNYEDYSEPKYENCHVMGSPSGGGFRFVTAVGWRGFVCRGAPCVERPKNG